MTAPADSVWRVGFTEERAVVMSSRSGHTSMEVFSFESPEMVNEKAAARARAREVPAFRDMKKKARTDPSEDIDEENSDDSRGLWGGMDMVREGSDSVEDAEMFLGTPIARVGGGSKSDAR
jgi:hypothetical protein